MITLLAIFLFSARNLHSSSPKSASLYGCLALFSLIIQQIRAIIRKFARYVT